MKKTFFGAVIVCATLFAVGCGNNSNSTVRMGSLSGDIDSLSYALGARIGFMMNEELSDLPFNFDRIVDGLKEGALDKSKMMHDDAVAMLRNYLMNSRTPRAMEVMRQRAEADSIRRAAGDSTEMKYEADPSMFATEGERDSLSYALGNDFGYFVRTNGEPVQLVWMIEGIKEAQEEAPRMSHSEVENFLQDYFLVKRPAMNAEESAKWLEKIANKSGVKKTESGLLYKIEKAGDPNLKAVDDRDVIIGHYKGMLRSGKVFDASRFVDMPVEKQNMLKQYRPEDFDKDEPLNIPLNNLIKGWGEGLKLIGKGGKIQLWIPSDLAYGPRGNRGIGPNEALYFEVELEDVIPYEAPAAEATVETPEAQAE